MPEHDRHAEAFKEEAYELLAELETSLIELEERPDDADLISRIFRAMHTIKGSGSMFGFDKIAEFTHEVETVYDLVRSGEVPVTKDLINLTLKARDRIRSMLDGKNGVPADRAVMNEIVSSLRNLRPSKDVSTDIIAESLPPVPDVSGENVTYRVHFRPPRDILTRGLNPINLLNDLRTLGGCIIMAQGADIPYLEEIASEHCYICWDIILTTKLGIDAIRDVFLFVEDGSGLKIEVIDEGIGLEDTDTYKKLGEILVERGDISKDALHEVLKEQKRLGEMLIEKGFVEPHRVEAALLEQKYVKEHLRKTESGSSIRVASEKLDALVDLAGELVTVQARLSRLSGKREDPELLSVSEEVERLTSNLRDNTMNIRMLPIGTTFSKFKRLVRDLSNELGKEIELTTDGAETELDKTVIEKLNDPLVHLIRNSIDHGIEMPDEREAKGKLRKGMIHLSAVHSGANVFIRIMDNGSGLDSEVIRIKAVEKGLLSPDAELSEKEIFSLIFAPGFSTAKQVTNVSGRGVGMDVVKRSIESLRGSIEIESRKGCGTTITLLLPLTLAIIDGFLVRVSGEHFVLPLSAVVECMELTPAHIAGAHGRDIVNVRGGIVPYIRLRKHFSMNGSKKPDIEHLVITGVEGGRVGFVADQIIGEHQTVIKNLGTFYKDVEGVSGATILGDGTVALILDVPKLAQRAERDELTMH